MKIFVHGHNFVLGSGLLALLTVIRCNASVLAPRLVMLASQADTRMIADGCSTEDSVQPACSVISGNWNTKQYHCGTTTITSAALKTVSDGILTSPGTPLSKAERLASGCTINGTGEVYAIEHDPWVLYYTITTKCECAKGTGPTCIGAYGASNQACNIASFAYCKIVLNGSENTPCVAT